MSSKNTAKKKLPKKLIILIGLIAFICLALLVIVLGVIFGAGRTDSSDKNNSNFDGFEIYSLEIVLDGKPVKNISKEFNDDDFLLTFRANDGQVDFTQQKTTYVEWTIVETDALGCTIDKKGLFSIGNKLGSVTVNLKVQSKNIFETSIKVTITASEVLVLQEIEVFIVQEGLEFIEGQSFDPGAIELYLHYVDIEKALAVSAYTYKKEPLTLFDTEIELGINFAGVDQIVTVPITVKPKTLQRIEIASLPNKISYVEGQYLDLTGLVVTCHYEYISEIVTDYYIDILDDILTTDYQKFTISYISGSIIKTAEVKISVAPRQLQSIEIVSLPKKTMYIQGQTFNPNGMKVMAHFEYIDTDVTELIEWDRTGMLVLADKCVVVSYEENKIIKSQEIPITVDLPYSSVRKIVFENPFDATLSWVYSYSNDGQSQSIDNTLIDGHSNLLFDPQNGIYIAPVGAIITVMRVSPAITGFTIDGQDWDLIYPTNNIDFELYYEENDLEIGFSKVIGERITIRFSSAQSGANWAFIYPLNYLGTLRSSELEQIASIYEDTETYYFEYAIGQDTYSFAELCSISFNTDTLITVTRVNRVMKETVSLNVVYPDSSTFIFITERADEFAFDKLPRVEKYGYNLIFSITPTGEALNAEMFKEWLTSIDSAGTIYAVYELNTVEIIGDIVGSWNYSYNADDREFAVTVNFNSDGTYTYETVVDGILNCCFGGIYTCEDGLVYVLSLEYEGVNQMIAIDDFEVILEDNCLKATLFVIEGLSVLKGNIILGRVE